MASAKEQRRYDHTSAICLVCALSCVLCLSALCVCALPCARAARRGAGITWVGAMVGPLAVGARVGRVVGDRLGVWTDKGAEIGPTIL